MEHFYKKLKGQQWFTYPKLYKDMVEKCDNNSHFVEIGVWKGRSTCYMGVEIINSGKNIKFDCVDTFDGGELHSNKNNQEYDSITSTKDGLYNEFIDNIKQIKNVISDIHRMTSEQASFLYVDESLDFVFIDAAHDYVNVMNDIIHWYPKVKKGGYISGHDYKGEFNGVTTAVNQYFGYFGIEIEELAPSEFIYSPEKCWLVKKSI